MLLGGKKLLRVSWRKSWNGVYLRYGAENLNVGAVGKQRKLCPGNFQGCKHELRIFSLIMFKEKFRLVRNFICVPLTLEFCLYFGYINCCVILWRLKRKDGKGKGISYILKLFQSPTEMRFIPYEPRLRLPG